MKNGFTLIELIGTVVIISLALLIIIPIVSRSMKKGVADADKQAIASVELAAENYNSDNPGSSCVTVTKLQDEGYLDDNLKRPSDSSNLTGRVMITKTVTNSKKIKYTFKYETDVEC